MTCEWCDDKKTMRLVDSWTMLRKRDMVPYYIDGIPCPGCQEADADGWLIAKTERDGPPYPNTTGGYWSLWERKGGEKVAALKPLEADD